MHFEGSMSGRERRDACFLRRDIQIIFQDPYASLNPRMKIGAIVGEALIIHRLNENRRQFEERSSTARDRRLAGRPYGTLSRRVLRRPAPAHRHRAGARRRAQLIICDEPVSALDVSSRPRSSISWRICSRNSGSLISSCPRSVGRRAYQRARGGDVSRAHRRDRAGPRSLYLAAASLHRSAVVGGPIPDPKVKRERIRLQGEVPSPIYPPSGAIFTPVPIAQFPECNRQTPALKQSADGYWVACHFR